MAKSYISEANVVFSVVVRHVSVHSAVDQSTLGHAIFAHMLVLGETDGHIRVGWRIGRPQFKLVTLAFDRVRDQRRTRAILDARGSLQAETAFDVATARVD